MVITESGNFVNASDVFDPPPATLWASSARLPGDRIIAITRNPDSGRRFRDDSGDEAVVDHADYLRRGSPQESTRRDDAPTEVATQPTTMSGTTE